MSKFVIRARWVSYKDKFGNYGYEEGVGWAVKDGGVVRDRGDWRILTFDWEADAWDFLNASKTLTGGDKQGPYAWVEEDK